MNLEESIQYLASSMNLLSREIDQLTRTLKGADYCFKSVDEDNGARLQRLHDKPLDENNLKEVLQAIGETPESIEQLTAAGGGAAIAVEPKKKAGRPPGARNKKPTAPVVESPPEAGLPTEPEPEPEPEPSEPDPTEPSKPVTHEDIRAVGRVIISNGGTDTVRNWVREQFEVESISMIPAERLPEALASIKKLVA